MSETASTEMPRYRSHKTIWAFKIASILPLADGSAKISPEEPGYAAFDVDAEYMKKHNPQVGGYFVQYQDGYKSWSPAEAFEGGYTREN
jgi:hypothetical protein